MLHNVFPDKEKAKSIFKMALDREKFLSSKIDYPNIIIENYYGEHFEFKTSESKTFVGATRKLVWKNLDILEQVFKDVSIKSTGTILDQSVSSYDELIVRIQSSFAVILISLGDISPNMILDAIRCSKPFIVTHEIGIKERIKDIAIFVDPLDSDDIKRKIIWLCNEENYKKQQMLVKAFEFTHPWKQIGDELIQLTT